MAPIFTFSPEIVPSGNLAHIEGKKAPKKIQNPRNRKKRFEGWGGTKYRTSSLRAMEIPLDFKNSTPVNSV
jgi:hypothetical protein